MSDVSHAANVCACAARRVDSPPRPHRPATRDVRRRRMETAAARTSVGASGMTTAATHASNSTNTSSVRPPRRPIDLTSAADATPVMSSETTSGITVIRMAFTQNVPIGAMASAAWSSGALPDAAMATPPMTAAPSATRTRVLSFI